MGKDRVENDIVCKHLNINDNGVGIISSIILDSSLKLKDENIAFYTHEIIKRMIGCRAASTLSIGTPDKSREIKRSSAKYFNGRDGMCGCDRCERMNSSFDTSDTVLCDNGIYPCLTYNSKINDILVVEPTASALDSKNSGDINNVDVEPKMSLIDNAANQPVGNEDNGLFDIGRLSGETFYQGVTIQNFSTPNCSERSNETRDMDTISRKSPSRQTPSPMRSQSPYNCGGVPSFREPGNISSQHFQVDWNTANGADVKKLNSMTMCESESVLMDDLSERNDNRNGFLPYESKNGVNAIEDEDSNDTARVFVMSYDQNDEKKTYHPKIPVIEDTDVKRPPISSNIFNGLTCYEKLDEGKKRVASEEQKTAQLCKNDNLVRVSHFTLVDNHFKRVMDIRTVTELMTIYASLKRPIILPFARQRNYYDQWARFPCGDVISRGIYPRSSTNMSIKCWTLLQAIQSDQVNQMKSNSAPPAPIAGTSNRLAVPNPADVTCKSLDSIIEHYNQISSVQNPIFNSRGKTPPATPLKSLGSKSSSVQSSSSRSSSGNSNDRQRTVYQCSNQSKETATLPHAIGKHSPVPLRKKTNQKQTHKVSYQNNETNQSKIIDASESETFQDGNRRQEKNTSKASSLGKNSQIEYLAKRLFAETSPIPTAEVFSSGDDFKSSTLSKHDGVSNNECNHQSFGSNYSPADHILDFNENNEREQPLPITAHGNDVSETLKRDISPGIRTPEKRRIFSPGRDMSRDPYDVNTSTVRLNLPHEIPLNKNDNNENPGERRGSSHQTMSNSNNGMVGLARRSKTRLFLNQMNPKPEHREISFMASPLHNPHHLKQTLLINEMQCSKDIDGKYLQKRDKVSRKTGRSRSSTSWKNSTQKPPELPTRGYSMCERLEPSENSVRQIALSPEIYKPRSERQSAVSLANVHFLDLTDLKTMLRKNNTPIPRL